MSEFVPVEHREEVQVRAVEEGEVIHTLAGPQYPSVGQYVVRRRNVAIPSDTDTDALRAALRERGQDDQGDRDALVDRLFPWEDRVADASYVAHHFKVEDVEELSPEVDDDQGEDYYSRTVAELRAEVERRNGERGEDDEPVTVEEPGNKPELVAALEADDERANGD